MSFENVDDTEADDTAGQIKTKLYLGPPWDGGSVLIFFPFLFFFTISSVLKYNSGNRTIVLRLAGQ